MSERVITKTQELIDRYRETIVVTDDFGRAITVGRLKPSEKRKLFEMTESTSVMVCSPMLFAASVRSLNNEGQTADFAFPRTIAEVDSRIDILDEEGMRAIAGAYRQLNPTKDSNESQVETVKN